MNSMPHKTKIFSGVIEYRALGNNLGVRELF